MGLSVGCGFRLSDPRILAHESQVWSAFAAAPLTVPLMEASMPKMHAEWLLGGHGACVAEAIEIGRKIDWEVHVILQGVRKAVVCSAEARSWPDGAATTLVRARLPLDHAYAMRDLTAEHNPSGIRADAALRMLRPLGAVAHPLAGMGPMDPRWASRSRWLPMRSGTLDPFGRDGTHMGWPADMDLRYFQLAPEDQRLPVDHWTGGAEFALTGVGRDGRGFQGRLPDLAAQLMVRRGRNSPMESVSLKLQTVWFLPDADMGVMWWSGTTPIDCLLSEEIDMAVAAVRDTSAQMSVEQLEMVLNRRTSGRTSSAYAMRDSDLLPDRAHGWAWELILSPRDHPDAMPAAYSHQSCLDRMDDFESQIDDMLNASKTLAALRKQAKDEPWKEGEALLTAQQPPARSWREQLGDKEPLTNADIIRAELRGVQVADKRLDSVRLTEADLNHSQWSGCEFHAVDFTRCRMDNATFARCRFVRCRFAECSLSFVSIDGCELDSCSLGECNVDHARFADNTCVQLTHQALRGAGFAISNSRWDGVTWQDCNVRQARWSDIRATSCSMSQCRFDDLAVTACHLERLSIVDCKLAKSTWLRCSGSSMNCAGGTSLSNAKLEDCTFGTSSWVEVDAAHIQVRRCVFKPLYAKGLQAPESRWEHSDLSGANLMHAYLLDMRLEATSLKDANMYGADLRGARIKDSNLIRLQAGWVREPEALTRRGNLSARAQLVPRRGA